MNDNSDIQWSDTTVNSIMGCKFELFRSSGRVPGAIDKAVSDQIWKG